MLSRLQVVNMLLYSGPETFVGLQVFDDDNSYVARSSILQKQMKNLQWLLGNPFEVFVNLDTKETQFNEKKNDIVDDALLRDIFYGSIHTAVAFDVLKRFEKGLNSIVASLDTEEAAAAEAAAAKKSRVQPDRQGPSPRSRPPVPQAAKAAQEAASPSKAVARGTKRANNLAVSKQAPQRRKRRPVADSPSVGSARLVGG